MKLESLVLELFADTSRLDREVKSAVDRAASQIKKLEQGNLSVKVNEKSLHDLNRLLDVKQAHIKQTAEVFKNTPLVVKVDDSQVKTAKSEIKLFKSEFSGVSGKAKAEITHRFGTTGKSKPLELSNRILSQQVSVLNQINSKTQKRGLFSDVRTGLFAGLGQSLSSEFSKGFQEKFQERSGIDLGYTGKLLGDAFGRLENLIENSVKGIGKNITKTTGIDNTFNEFGEVLATSLLDAIESSVTPTELAVNFAEKLALNVANMGQSLQKTGKSLMQMQTYLAAIGLGYDPKTQSVLQTPLARSAGQAVAPLIESVATSRKRAGQEKAIPLVLERASEIIQNSKNQKPFTPDMAQSAIARGKSSQLTSRLGDEKSSSVSVIDENTNELFLTVGGYAGHKNKASGYRIASDIAMRAYQQGRTDIAALGIRNPDTDIDPEMMKYGTSKTLGLAGSLSKPNLRGYSKDAVEIAAQAVAAIVKNPNLQVKVVGESGGGYAAEEAIALLQKMGYGANVSGIALGTPNFIAGSNPNNFTKLLGKNKEETLGYETHQVYAQMGLADVSAPSQNLTGLQGHPYENYANTDEYMRFAFGIKSNNESSTSLRSQDIEEARTYINDILASPDKTLDVVRDNLKVIFNQISTDDNSPETQSLVSDIDGLLNNDELLESIKQYYKIIETAQSAIPQAMAKGDAESIKTMFVELGQIQLKLQKDVIGTEGSIKERLLFVQKQIQSQMSTIGDPNVDSKTFKFRLALQRTNEQLGMLDVDNLNLVNKELSVLIKEITDDKSFNIKPEAQRVKSGLIEAKKAVITEIKSLKTSIPESTDIWDDNYSFDADLAQSSPIASQPSPSKKKTQKAQSVQYIDPFASPNRLSQSMRENDVVPGQSDFAELINVNKQILEQVKLINKNLGNKPNETKQPQVFQGELLDETQPQQGLLQKLLKGGAGQVQNTYGIARGAERFFFDTVKGVTGGLVNLEAAKKVTQTVAPAFALGALGSDIPLIGEGISAVSNGVVSPLIEGGLSLAGGGFAALLPEGLTSGAATVGGFLSHFPGYHTMAQGMTSFGEMLINGAAAGTTYLLGGRLAQKGTQFALNQAMKPIGYLPPSIQGDNTYNLLKGVGDYTNNAVNVLSGKGQKTLALPPQREPVLVEVLSPALPQSYSQARALPPASDGMTTIDIPVERIREAVNLGVNDDSPEAVNTVIKEVEFIRKKLSEFNQQLQKEIDRGRLTFAQVGVNMLDEGRQRALQDLSQLIEYAKEAGLNTNFGTSSAIGVLNNLKSYLSDGNVNNPSGSLGGSLKRKFKVINERLPNADLIDIGAIDQSLSAKAQELGNTESLESGQKILQALSQLEGIDLNALFAKNGKLNKAGKEVMAGLKASLLDGKGDIEQTTLEIASILPDRFKKILGIASPSKVFIKIGQDTALGFIIGVNGEIEKIKRLQLPSPDVEEFNDFESIERYKDTIQSLGADLQDLTESARYIDINVDDFSESINDEILGFTLVVRGFDGEVNNLIGTLENLSQVSLHTSPPNTPVNNQVVPDPWTTHAVNTAPTFQNLSNNPNAQTIANPWQATPTQSNAIPTAQNLAATVNSQIQPALAVAGQGLGTVTQQAQNAMPAISNLLGTLKANIPILGAVTDKFNQLKDTIVSFGTGAAKLLVFAFLAKQLADLGVEAVNVYRRFEGIFVASRLVGDGAKYLEEVREQTKALGGDLESTMRSAIQFSTALVGTNLESTGQQLFLDSDKALKSLGLQTQEYDNAMRAIIQISSKGKVSMEELSGQLGEQVPGALQIAADAMQTNVRGLIQMVSSGNLLAEEFVPKFVQQLKNRTAFLAPAVEQSLNASLGRLGAQKEDLFINIGAELSPAIIPLVNGLSTALKGVVDNFDAILFSAKALGLYLVSPAIIGGLKLIANNAVMLFTSLIAWMGKVQITAKTMWAVLAGPFKLVGILGATAGIEALIYVMQGGAKTFKSANEELSTFVESLGKVAVTPRNKNFFENQKEILYNFYLRPFDEQKAKEELESLTSQMDNSIAFTVSNLNTDGIDDYVARASALQSQIDQIRAQKDVLMMEDPVKNKDAISVLEDQLYGINGLITKTQKELNDLFVFGGRAGIEEQIRIIESAIQKIKSTSSSKDDEFLPKLQSQLSQLRTSLGLFDTAQEKVFNSLNRQRKAWIDLTSAIAGYEYELTKAITKAETKLYQYFNDNNIGTETQSYLIAEFDVARQEAEVNKLEQFLKARAQYLGNNLTVDSMALVKEITGKSIIEIDVEGINKIEKLIQNNDSIKTIITEQVLDQLQGIAQDSQALEQARLELEKGKNSLRQAKITEEDYRINLSRSIFDFNKDLEVQLLGIQNQFRDYNRQLEDAAINSAKMVRGLIESYQDLNFDLEQNILTVQNEILDAQERLKLTNLKIQSESIDPGQDTIAKRAGSIILRLFESINSGESEKRRRLQEANQAQKEYTDTLRRIRDFEEQVMQERINQKRQIEDLTNGFKNLNQAVKDLVEQLNRSRDDLIRNTKNQSGRDISGQLQGVPSVAEMGQVNAVNPMAVNPIYTYQQSQRYPYAFDPEPEQVIRVAPQPRSNDSDFIRYGYGATPKYPDRAPDFYHSPAPRGYNPFSDIPMAPSSPVKSPKKSSYIDRNNQPTGAEREFLIRLTAAEARGEGLLGQVLFARSVGNRQDVNNPRAYLAKSNSLLDIMTAKNQYQAVRSGAINQNFSPKVIQTATQAVSLMDNVDWIKSELRKQGYKESEIKKLVNATGMRTPSAFGDSSQQYNRVRYKGHIFNSDKNAKDKLQSNLNFGITGFENVKGEYAQASGVIDWLGDVYGIGQKPKLPTTPMYPTWKGNPYPQNILQNPSGIYSPKNPAAPQPKPATPTPIAPAPTTNIPPLPKPVDKPAFKFDKQFNFSDHRPQLIPLPQIKAVPDLKAPNFDSIIKPIPQFNTQALKDKATEIRTLKNAFTAINLATIDADKKLAGLTAISEMAQLVMTTADGIRQMDFNLVSSADTVNRMTQESKGYLRTVEEINNVALDTARSYDNEINSRQESALQLRREVGSSAQQLSILKQQLNSRTDIDTTVKSTLLSEIDSLESLINIKNNQASILETEAQRLAKNRDIAIYNKLAREEQQRQLALLEELSSAQLALSNARFERGGSLFNVGVITAARAEAEKLNANAKLWAEKNNGFLDPKRIQEYVKGQKELGEINIAQSYLDAIPALRDFSSGLKDIILMTSTWQEVTKKLVDTFAALVLDSLVIKPMQNWLAQGIAGIMGWTGDATAPIKFSKPKSPIEENFGNVLIDTTANLGLFNSNLESSNSIIPNFITGLLGILGSANDSNGFEFGSIISHVFGFAKGSDNIPNYASGIDSALNKERLESGKDPYLAVLHKGEAVLSTLNGDAQLLRNLKANGQWEHLKANREIDNYAYGTEMIVNRPNRQTKETNQTTIYKPEYKIYTQNADSFRKSQRQIEQETMARMRRAKR